MFQALTIRAATSNVLRQATAVNRKMLIVRYQSIFIRFASWGITSHKYGRRSLFRCVSAHGQIWSHKCGHGAEQHVVAVGAKRLEPA